MQKVQDGLHGKFIPLRRAVAAIAARITIPDGEFENRQGLNAALDANDFVATLDRAIIRNVVSEARAAAILLDLLNQPSASRPQWFDAASGYPILDDSVGRQGIEALIQWKRGEVALVVTGGPRDWPALSPPAPELMGRPSRSMQIGFNVDELIRFLDARGVAHNLGEAKNLPTQCQLPHPAQSVIASPDAASSRMADAGSDATPAAEAATQFHGHFNDASRPGKRCAIEREIRQAQARCVDRHRAEAVMLCLMDMARAGHDVLCIENNCLHYVKKGRLAPYTMRALSQFIAPKAEAKREAAVQKRRAADAAKVHASGGKCDSTA